jgi:hypothetical protein
VSGEIQSLRSDVAAVVAVRGSSDGGGGEPADLAPITAQLSSLSEQLTALASAPRPDGAPAVVGDGNVDAAITAAEQRLMAHVDDAVFALAQTLLGRGGAATALVDVPAPPQGAPAPVAAPAPSLAPAVAAAADEDDEDYDDDDEDDEDYDDDEESDAAEIDFSQAELDDEDDDTTSWQRPAADEADEDEAEAEARNQWGPGPQTFAGGPRGSAPVPGVDAPFDQEAAWGPPPLPVPPEGPSTVVPERRRRWFSW